MVNPSVVVEKCCESRADNGDVMNAINIQGNHAAAVAERVGLNAGDRAERLGLENLRANAMELAATKDAALAACREFGEVKLEMAKEIARLSREMSECCCETKQLIAEKACQTDALINRLDRERLKEELATLRLVLVATQASNGLPINVPAVAKA